MRGALADDSQEAVSSDGVAQDELVQEWVAPVAVVSGLVALEGIVASGVVEPDGVSPARFAHGGVAREVFRLSVLALEPCAHVAVGVELNAILHSEHLALNGGASRSSSISRARMA